ncbi:MAG: 2-hydroxyglutaryl-CoA dehydratase [Deltaproteobacteria bacterium]|nr:2-hydroxyglutaryl-CoA dehydratase [Deltaproteobacteria bacterium]MBW1921558.1 2-hydroxyglutaryl-CoA dehydratase [Deltaproteobacteria bacterium]
MGKRIYAGIDIGSLSSEAVILGENGILGYSVRNTGADPQRVAQECMEEALARANVAKEDVLSIVATGYGRIRVPFADREITEITCHAKGAHFLFPETRTVIDIGGQDSKVITLDERGAVTDFAMNDRCAAGTGRFLEVMATALETKLSELGQRSLEAKKGVPISSMCTVFAESEVISLIAEGKRREEIMRGLHEAISSRVYRMAKKLRVKKEITFTGGVAKNQGIVKVLEVLFKMPVNVPDEPQIVGALGAALYARSAGPRAR